MASAPALNFPITATDKTGRAFSAVSGRVRGLSSTFGALSAAVAAIGFVGVMNEVVQVSREFGVLQASLKTVTGSAGAAAEAFDMVQAFASTTPFSVKQATEAFVRLKSLGLEPSEEAMRSYGNTASAMGKDLIQYVEAIADATTGEFERLKEFGIKASTEGENVSFTFQGVTTTVKKNADEIEAYLRAIGENEFAGAMAERAATLDGALSNLSDSTAMLALKVGEGGLAKGVSDVARALSSASTQAGAAAGEFGRLTGIILSGFADQIPNAMSLFTDYMKFVVSFWTEAFQQLVDVLGWVADKFAALPLIGEKFAAWSESLKETSFSVEEFQTKWESGTNAIEAGGQKIEVVSRVISEGLTPALDEAGVSASKTGKELDRMAVRIKRSIETPAESAARKLEELEAVYESGRISAEEYSRAQEQVAKELERDLERIADGADKTTEGFGELGDTVVDVFKRGELSAESFLDIGLKAFDLLFNKAKESEGLGNIFGGGSGGGGIGGGFDLGSIVTGIGDWIPDFGGFFADGGDVAAGKPIVVGERGPELYVPGATGSIIPNHLLGGGGGPIIVNATTNIYAEGAEIGFADRMREIVREEEPRTIAAAIDAVEREAGRGGGFAKSMGRRS